MRPVILLVLLSGAAAAQSQPAPGQLSPWWRERAPGAQRYTADAKKLPLLRVQGNRFVDPDGKTVLLRGLAISDPDKIESQGHWNRDHFVKVKEMGAKIVRIPVHPVAWRGRSPAAYLKLLDQAVEWCTSLDMYIDLDWHSIGNLTTGLFQDPMYDTSLQETYSFWRTVARHYAGHNTVVFYELFNEPTTFSGQLGRVDWSEWKRIQENLIGIIRAYNPQAIVLVAGFDWAYDLTPLREAPIAAENIAYTTHPYAHKRQQPWEAKWEEDFGFAAAKWPVVATEFGGANAPLPAGAEADARAAQAAAYGPAIYDYFERKGISWMVWCFDPQWGPALLKDWDYNLTPSGEYAKQRMLNPPAPPSSTTAPPR